MTIKKAISLQDDIFQYGKDKADKLFSKNFSAYVAFLISKDREEEPTIQLKQKDRKLTSIIDNIMDI